MKENVFMPCSFPDTPIKALKSWVCGSMAVYGVLYGNLATRQKLGCRKSC